MREAGRQTGDPMIPILYPVAVLSCRGGIRIFCDSYRYQRIIGRETWNYLHWAATFEEGKLFDFSHNFEFCSVSYFLGCTELNATSWVFKPFNVLVYLIFLDALNWMQLHEYSNLFVGMIQWYFVFPSSFMNSMFASIGYCWLSWGKLDLLLWAAGIGITLFWFFNLVVFHALLLMSSKIVLTMKTIENTKKNFLLHNPGELLEISAILIVDYHWAASLRAAYNDKYIKYYREPKSAV